MRPIGARPSWTGARRLTDEGATLVEFALIVPVLIVLLLAILDVSRGVNAYVTVSAAAREGSHYAALHPTSSPADIASAVRSRVQPLEASAVFVDAFYHDGTAFQPWPPTGIPASSPRPSYVPAQVRVSYSWAAVSALIGRYFSSGAMSASSTVDVLR